MLAVGLDIKNNSITRFVAATAPDLLDGISVQQHPGTFLKKNLILKSTLKR